MSYEVWGDDDDGRRRHGPDGQPYRCAFTDARNAVTASS